MSAIGTATSHASDISALLLANSPNAPRVANSSSPTAKVTSDSGSGSDDRGPATNVQLSDKVKSILAQAANDATVAQHLQSFVDANRTDQAADNSPEGTGSKIDVDKAFQQLTGGTGSAAGTDASAASQTPGPVQVVKSFASGLSADGYTVSALASDIDGSSRIVIRGQGGSNFLDERFGRSDEFAGGSSASPGRTQSEYQAGNVEYVTFSEDIAASASAETSSSAGSASVSSSAAETRTTTIAVDFNTGQITLTQAEALSTASSAQTTPPSLSTVA